MTASHISKEIGRSIDWLDCNQRTALQQSLLGDFAFIMIKSMIRKLAWKVLGPPPSDVRRKASNATRIDTMKLRRDILELSLLNLSICTRGERNAIANGEQEGPAHDSLIGDYVEFGVYQGASFAHVCNTASEYIPEMRFFAFDSFEGLPELRGVDVGGEFYQGQFGCSRDQFEKNLVKAGVNLDRVIISQGWFDKTLTKEFCDKEILSTVSLAFIDCDLYESCVPVLEFLTPLLRQGSILLFDDWYNFRAAPDRGVQRATLEWLQQNEDIQLRTWLPFCHHGQAFIVNRPALGAETDIFFHNSATQASHLGGVTAL